MGYKAHKTLIKGGTPMRKRLNAEMVTVNGKTVNVGIDVHKVSWHVTALVEGVIVESATIKPCYRVLKKLLARFAGGTLRIAYEAGPTGFSLYDELVADGIDCIVVPPSLIPVESGNRVKTDKRDSKKLAQYLENNRLKKVYVLSKQERAHRQFVRTRRQLSDHRTDVMRQIKSLLLFHGIPSPGSAKRFWTRPVLRALRSITPDEYVSRSLNTLIDLYEYLTQQVKHLTREVRRLARTETYARRVALLTSIPGIGILSAMEVLVELQEVSRFATADQIAAFLGLTPSQYSSGQHVRMGKITHAGNHRLRTRMVECSWIAIKKDPFLHKTYEEIKKRRGAKRAIVAVSRKLIIRIRRILLDEVTYRLAYATAA
jgi:transposase